MVADEIAETVSSEWENYGVLPSVAVAQAIIESGLGEVCMTNNLWGLGCGRFKYESLHDGIYGYMGVLNDNFKSCLYLEDYHDQVRKIADNGYAQPKDGYYEKVVNAIDSYELYEYDREMFDEIERKRKEEIKAAQEYLLHEKVIRMQISNIFEWQKIKFYARNKLIK